MDFSHRVTSPSQLATTACDALLVVTVGDKLDKALRAALGSVVSGLLDDAVAQGDLALKSGKSLYLHRPVGVSAKRLVFAVAGASSPKAIKAAMAGALAQIKSGGTKHAAVAVVGAGTVGAAHAEVLVAAATDAAYVYRHTKPSAPAAAALGQVDFAVHQGGVQGGCRRTGPW